MAERSFMKGQIDGGSSNDSGKGKSWSGNSGRVQIHQKKGSRQRQEHPAQLPPPQLLPPVQVQAPHLPPPPPQVDAPQLPPPPQAQAPQLPPSPQVQAPQLPPSPQVHAQQLPPPPQAQAPQVLPPQVQAPELPPPPQVQAPQLPPPPQVPAPQLPPPQSQQPPQEPHPPPQQQDMDDDTRQQQHDEQQRQLNRELERLNRRQAALVEMEANMEQEEQPRVHLVRGFGKEGNDDQQVLNQFLGPPPGRKRARQEVGLKQYVYKKDFIPPTPPEGAVAATLTVFQEFHLHVDGTCTGRGTTVTLETATPWDGVPMGNEFRLCCEDHVAVFKNSVVPVNNSVMF